MKRRLSISAALVLTVLAHSGRILAQEVVIDPSQIAASATNAAEQIDYAIDQLSELSSLGGTMDAVKTFMDEFFGDDGLGSTVLNFVQDLGTLDRLTESFNSTMNSISAYAAQLKARDGLTLSDTNTMLAYLNNAKRQALYIVDYAKLFLSKNGITVADKERRVRELEKDMKELEKEVKGSMAALEDLAEARQTGEAMADVVKALDKEMGPESYASALKVYGTQNSAGRSTMSLISLLFGIMGLASVVTSLITYSRGGIMGDPRIDQVFIRLGVGLTAGSLLISMIGRFAGIAL